METPEYEQYGLTEEQWNEMDEESKENYRSVGQSENGSEISEEALEEVAAFEEVPNA